MIEPFSFQSSIFELLQQESFSLQQDDQKDQTMQEQQQKQILQILNRIIRINKLEQNNTKQIDNIIEQLYELLNKDKFLSLNKIVQFQIKKIINQSIKDFSLKKIQISNWELKQKIQFEKRNKQQQETYGKTIVKTYQRELKKQEQDHRRQSIKAKSVMKDKYFQSVWNKFRNIEKQQEELNKKTIQKICSSNQTKQQNNSKCENNNFNLRLGPGVKSIYDENLKKNILFDIKLKELELKNNKVQASNKTKNNKQNYTNNQTNQQIVDQEKKGFQSEEIIRGDEYIIQKPQNHNEKFKLKTEQLFLDLKEQTKQFVEQQLNLIKEKQTNLQEQIMSFDQQNFQNLLNKQKEITESQSFQELIQSFQELNEDFYFQQLKANINLKYQQKYEQANAFVLQYQQNNLIFDNMQQINETLENLLSNQRNMSKSEQLEQINRLKFQIQSLVQKQLFDQRNLSRKIEQIFNEQCQTYKKQIKTQQEINYSIELESIQQRQNQLQQNCQQIQTNSLERIITNVKQNNQGILQLLTKAQKMIQHNSQEDNILQLFLQQIKEIKAAKIIQKFY